MIKKIVFAVLALLLLTGCPKKEEPVDYKPVIYLYPESETEVSVRLHYDGRLTATYPQYNDGWQVTASPDGTLKQNGREYYCLFWEGTGPSNYDFSTGFTVKGSEAGSFLEEKLRILGLTDREADEFIIYWLPLLQDNEYNLISFQQEAYTSRAELEIEPAPDSVLRVFMAVKPLDSFKEVPAQELPAFERKGFTVVEWGGSIVR